MIACPGCGNEAQDTAVFCDQCGTRLKEPAGAAAAGAPVAPAPEPEGMRCPACGYANVPGEMFCENCGVPLEALEPEPAVADVAAEAAVAAPAEPVPAAPAEPVPAAPAEAAPVSAEAVEPESVAPPLAATPVPAGACPACGAPVGADDEFCDNCGAALTPATPTAAPEAAPAPAAAPTVAGPRLVVADTGAEIPLPAGDEILVGREDPISGVFPDIDLTPHGGEEGGVSRKHARIRARDGRFTVEDLDSTNFTFVNRQRLTPGSPQPIADGDELRLGRVRLLFRSQ